MVMGLEQSAVLVLDEIVRRAVRAKASDIHLEPKRDRLNVRFRVDGEMVEEQAVPIEIALEVISRVKACLDIYVLKTEPRFYGGKEEIRLADRG